MREKENGVPPIARAKKAVEDGSQKDTQGFMSDMTIVQDLSVRDESVGQVDEYFRSDVWQTWRQKPIYSVNV